MNSTVTVDQFLVTAQNGWPSPVGLTLGILSVIVGQIFVLMYHYVRFHITKPLPIQKEEKKPYDFWEGVATHLAQPEGFVLLGGYLCGTWMFEWMPESYYSFEGGVNFTHLLLQLLIVDCIQTLMHIAEHRVHRFIYINSHKPHHRFLNPRLFDAFNGSVTDTILMILVPLYITALCVDANVWSYMAFGTVYANWLTLIHSEYPHPWDPYFRKIGFGTASDHHVHHKLFNYNFGHLFTYWDRMCGTYRSPLTVAKFRDGI